MKSTRPLAKHIVTNLPYGTQGLGDVFIHRALIHCQRTDSSVVMLLDLQWLCNPIRHNMFIKTPPSAIHLLDRLVCWPEGKLGHLED